MADDALPDGTALDEPGLQALAQEALAQLEAAMEEDDGWAAIGSADPTVRSAARSAADGIKCFRSTVQIPGRHARELAEIVWNLDLRRHYDPLFERAEVVHDLYPLRIVRLVYKAPVFLVSARDFCVLQAFHALPGGCFATTTRSIVHDDLPEGEGPVRGTLTQTGFFLRPIEDPVGPRCEITYTVRLDPKGLVPTWVTNLAMSSQAANMARFREWLSRGGDKEALLGGVVPVVRRRRGS